MDYYCRFPYTPHLTNISVYYLTNVFFASNSFKCLKPNFMWLKTLNRCDIRLKALSASISGSAPDKARKHVWICECSKYTGDRPQFVNCEVLEQSGVSDQMIRGGRGNGAFAQLVDVDQLKWLPACTSCFYSVHIVGYSKKIMVLLFQHLFQHILVFG